MPSEPPNPPEGERSQVEKGQFLTDTQRKYLQGEHEPPSDNAENTMRSKIRDRTIGAILDFELVSRNLPAKDRELLFNYKRPKDLSEKTKVGDSYLNIHHFDESPVGAWGYLGLTHCYTNIARFFYKLLRENGVSKDEMLKHLERVAEKGEHEVRHGFEWQEGWTEHGKRAVDVDADFRLTVIDEIDVERTRERWARGMDLSGLEIKALVESGEAELQINE